MLPLFANRLIDMMSRRLNSDMSYLAALNAASPRAFDKFLKAAALGNHREAVPVPASFAAKLAGVLFEDCGPCIQIVVDQARQQGMSDEMIAAVLAAEPLRMAEDVAIAWRFARAVLTRSSPLDALRETVRERWGDKGVVDLTVATQISRLYPMLKTGLGFAQSCQSVKVGAMVIQPAYSS